MQRDGVSSICSKPLALLWHYGKLRVHKRKQSRCEFLLQKCVFFFIIVYCGKEAYAIALCISQAYQQCQNPLTEFER